MEKVRLKVHVKGRVTIPKGFRGKMGINEGDYVEAIFQEDRKELIIRALPKDWLEDMLDVLRRAFPGKSTIETMKELRQGWEEYERT